MTKDFITVLKLKLSTLRAELEELQTVIHNDNTEYVDFMNQVASLLSLNDYHDALLSFRSEMIKNEERAKTLTDEINLTIDMIDN